MVDDRVSQVLPVEVAELLAPGHHPIPTARRILDLHGLPVHHVPHLRATGGAAAAHHEAIGVDDHDAGIGAAEGLEAERSNRIAVRVVGNRAGLGDLGQVHVDRVAAVEPVRPP